MELTREVVVDASVDEVWELLTVEHELATWLADDVDLDAQPGGVGRLAIDDEVWSVRVEEVDTARRLQLTWWPEEGGPASEVTFSVEEAEHGTRLRVSERIAASGGVGLKGRRADGSDLGRAAARLRAPLSGPGQPCQLLNRPARSSPPLADPTRRRVLALVGDEGPLERDPARGAAAGDQAGGRQAPVRPGGRRAGALPASPGGRRCSRSLRRP